MGVIAALLQRISTNATQSLLFATPLHFPCCTTWMKTFSETNIRGNDKQRASYQMV
jgi:hypothetical protein